jgi:sigma-B regulation protein RsbU (phosphoserine phosphatase)
LSQSVDEDLEDLYQNAPCGYLSLRPDGSIARANQTFCRWTGFTPAGLEGKRLHDLLTIAGRIFYETHFAPLLRMQGFFDEVALDILKKNGDTFPVLVNAAERTDENGKPQFIRITIFNAIDRRRYERELVKAREEQRTLAAALQREAELREQFIAVLGHDLRNPLAAIAAGIQLLQKATLDERLEKFVIGMQKSVVRIAGLIDNVLDFARGRLGGGITLQVSEQPLEPAIQSVIDELRTSHPEAAIETDIQITKSVPADSPRIAQLLSNLLGNALAYGTKGEPIIVQARTEGSHFELSVINASGPISKEVMDRMFRPFSHRDGDSHQAGLGLGLYIVAEIAKAHGGTMDVESNGGLIRFSFRMPIDHCKPAPI